MEESQFSSYNRGLLAYSQNYQRENKELDHDASAKNSDLFGTSISDDQVLHREMQRIKQNVHEKIIDINDSSENLNDVYYLPNQEDNFTDQNELIYNDDDQANSVQQEQYETYFENIQESRISLNSDSRQQNRKRMNSIYAQMENIPIQMETIEQEYKKVAKRRGDHRYKQQIQENQQGVLLKQPKREDYQYTNKLNKESNNNSRVQSEKQKASEEDRFNIKFHSRLANENQVAIENTFGDSIDKDIFNSHLELPTRDHLNNQTANFINHCPIYPKKQVINQRDDMDYPNEERRMRLSLNLQHSSSPENYQVQLDEKKKQRIERREAQEFVNQNDQQIMRALYQKNYELTNQNHLILRQNYKITSELKQLKQEFIRLTHNNTNNNTITTDDLRPPFQRFMEFQEKENSIESLQIQNMTDEERISKHTNQLRYLETQTYHSQHNERNNKLYTMVLRLEKEKKELHDKNMKLLQNQINLKSRNHQHLFNFEENHNLLKNSVTPSYSQKHYEDQWTKNQQCKQIDVRTKSSINKKEEEQKAKEIVSDVKIKAQKHILEKSYDDLFSKYQKVMKENCELRKRTQTPLKDISKYLINKSVNLSNHFKDACTQPTSSEMVKSKKINNYLQNESKNTFEQVTHNNLKTEFYDQSLGWTEHHFHLTEPEQPRYLQYINKDYQTGLSESQNERQSTIQFKEEDNQDEFVPHTFEDSKQEQPKRRTISQHSGKKRKVTNSRESKKTVTEKDHSSENTIGKIQIRRKGVDSISSIANSKATIKADKNYLLKEKKNFDHYNKRKKSLSLSKNHQKTPLISFIKI